ncbi:hypothetical protein BGW80DRAFT_1305215 [Lactifluus volemus]|nr:hypothetical protein BGW80DRAFT_1305215 [Lactifluus volemus]
METKAPRDTLAPYFDNSVTAVRRKFTSFEDSYVQPIYDLLKTLFLSYPVPFVFFSILVAFSIFPILAFIIVSAATLSVALTVALCIAFSFSTGVFLFLGGILVAILGLAFLLSGFLTTFATSTYFLGRLVVLLHRFGRSGFRAWYQEATHIFSPPSPRPALSAKDLHASDDSVNFVKREAKHGLTPKIEL